MEMVNEYLLMLFVGKREPLPFPQYLFPENRYKNDFWVTQEGECYYPHQMDDRHLLNTVRLLHRNYPGSGDRYIRCGGDKHILDGIKPWINRNGHRVKKHDPQMNDYMRLWERNRLYMLLRREVKIRGLERQI